MQLAGAAAREEVRRLGEDTLTTARVLAARPPLQRLIRAGNREQLELVPAPRLRPALNLDACAVVVGANVIASTRPGVAWTDALDATADQGERFMLAPAWQPDGLHGATAPMPNFVDTRVVVLRYLEPALARALSEQAGMQVRLVRLSNWLDNVEPDFKELHSTALSRARDASRERIEPRDLFASSTPIFASTGEGIALLEARLPASGERRRGRPASCAGSAGPPSC